MGVGASSRSNSRRSSTITITSLEKKEEKDIMNQETQNRSPDKGSLPTGPKLISGTDIMISYSHADSDMMKQVRGVLESEGFTVWVDVSGLTAGVDFLSKIGQAIIDAKTFISLLSEKTVSSRCCQDELALAYVSQKAIFPVGLQPPAKLFPLMDTGMRLQLARFDWFMINEPDIFDRSLQDLIRALRTELTKTDQTDAPTSKSGSAQPEDNAPRKTRSTCRTSVKRGNTAADSDILSDKEKMATFWERHFVREDCVPWERFSEAFKTEYQIPMKEIFGEAKTGWFVSLLHRELEVVHSDNVVTFAKYTDFCTVGGEFVPLWDRMQDQAVESYAAAEVFNMESSVRVEAIENLGKFKSAAVVEALLDLLEDPDNNVRTVAAISLAKTGTDSKRAIDKLLSILDDEDRLVRESGCLALGHLKAQKAVRQLVHLWRNDYISSVREACQVALEQIGGDEANKAMHITNLLAKEIRMLTQE